jgi:S-adenosylmethionine/arginine decarboxylase-like enzyme
MPNNTDDKYNTDDLRTDITLIKYDMEAMREVVKRVDSTISQLTEVIKTIAVQEKMFENNDKRIIALKTIIDKQAEDSSQMEKDFRKQLEINTLKFEEDNEKKHKELMNTLNNMKEELVSKIEKQDNRIHEIEKWKYYVIGISAVIIFTISQIEWPHFFN